MEISFENTAALAVQFDRIINGEWVSGQLTVRWSLSPAGWAECQKQIDTWAVRADFRNLHIVMVPYAGASPINVHCLAEAQEMAAEKWIPAASVEPKLEYDYVRLVWEPDGRIGVYRYNGIEDRSAGGSVYRVR